MKLDESVEEIRLLWCVIKILITTLAFNSRLKTPTMDNSLNSVFDQPHIQFSLWCSQCRRAPGLSKSMSRSSIQPVRIASIMQRSVKEFIEACFYKSFFFFTLSMTVTIPIPFQFYKLIEMSSDWERKSKLSQLRLSERHVTLLRNKLTIVIDG